MLTLQIIRKDVINFLDITFDVSSISPTIISLDTILRKDIVKIPNFTLW